MNGGVDMKVEYGAREDIFVWMNLVDEVRDNFPGLETEEAMENHTGLVCRLMRERRALCVKMDDSIVGVLLFSTRRNAINFLAVAPTYRRMGIATALVKKAISLLDPNRKISVTTFRANDPKGAAPRAFYSRLGFTPGELTAEFNYPLQVFVRPPEKQR